MLEYPVNLDINSFDSKYLYVQIFCILVFGQYFSYSRKINFGKISSRFSEQVSVSSSSLIIELIQLHFTNLIPVVLSFVQISVRTKTEIFLVLRNFSSRFFQEERKHYVFKTFFKHDCYKQNLSDFSFHLIIHYNIKRLYKSSPSLSIYQNPYFLHPCSSKIINKSTN